MAFYINRVTLLGRAANDPNLRYTPSGRAVLNLRIATSYSYQKDEEWVDVPQFTTCVFWGRQAEIIDEQISKGDYLYVEGRLQTRSWEGDDDRKRYATEVQVQDFVIPRNKGDSTKEKGTAPNQQPQPEAANEDIDEDSIPF
ncbi:MAG: single-stranded DNA-binding protein [Patescibacteria group bacterium]|nr:single-stranded DNA-binding protein [Patescibacteria group bacterium]